MFLALLLIATANASPCEQAYGLLAGKRVPVEERLKAANLEISQVRFQVQKGGVFSPVSIELMISGQPAGQIVASKHRGWALPFAESHIDITNVNLRGLGFGRMLYLSLAHELEKSGHTLVSTLDPSTDSLRTWESLVRQGLAKKVHFKDGTGGPDGVRYQMLPLDRNHPEVKFVLEHISELFLF